LHCLLFSPDRHNLGFLTEGKLAAILIIPSSWGSQQAGHSPRINGAEAVLPVEITHEAPRITAYDEVTSTEALQDEVDALDEARDKALERATQYQQSLRNYHSSRVCPRSFVMEDLVLRLKQDSLGKLESPWVGPYIITEVIPGGAYRLQDKKTEKDESNPWNAEQLRHFYA
jgi:hypothetical protein